MEARGWLIDVEGTLVGDKAYLPLPGAPAWIARLRAAGTPFRVLTNNTTLTRPEMGEALRAAGFDVKDGEILGSQDRAASMLLERGAPECWVLGSSSLLRGLEDAGLECRDLSREEPACEDRPRALVLGWMENPDARLLSRALDMLLLPGTLFLALHASRLFRNAGRVEPGLGAWAAALEYASGVRPLIAGKPSLELFEAAARDLDLSPGDIAMVGDDPEADLVPAAALGMRTVFVLSGKHRDAVVLDALPGGFRPDEVLGGVGELP